MPREEFPPGLDRGDFVPLSVMEFRRAYVLLQDGLDGLLPKDPDFPEFIQDAETGGPRAFEDTPFNRAWHAVAMHFDDIPKSAEEALELQRPAPDDAIVMGSGVGEEGGVTSRR